MKPIRQPGPEQELLPLACGGCGRCPFCTTRAVFLWTLTSGKIDQWGAWKASHARARSKTDSGVSGDTGVCTGCGYSRERCAAIRRPALKCCPDCSHDSRERGSAWDSVAELELFREDFEAALRELEAEDLVDSDGNVVAEYLGVEDPVQTLTAARARARGES